MHKTTTRLPLALTSLTVVTALYGCSTSLPSHDGSLHTVYGVDNSAPQQAVAFDQPAPEQQQVAPAESVEPMIQTISGTGVIASSPIIAIEADAQSTEEPELASTRTTMKNNSTEPAGELPRDHEHKLGAGETLFSVAGDLTGSSNNWKAIADYNKIDDPGAITVGQSIVIPGGLLIRSAEDEDLSNVFESLKMEQEAASEPQLNIMVSANGTQEIEFAALETLQEPSPSPISPSSAAAPVISSSPVRPNTASTEPKGSLTKSIANFASIIKTNFKLPAPLAAAITPNAKKTAMKPTPGETDTSSEVDATIQTAMLNQNQQQLTHAPAVPSGQAKTIIEQPDALPEGSTQAPALSNNQDQWLQVDGNFTPKAVYKGAGYTTGLLMRVSPGTKFKMTSKTDDWYEVETKQGAGYIFHRDVLLTP